MVYVYKKDDREHSEALIKRFMRRVQQSGTLMEVRRERFAKKPKTRAARRQEAIYKSEMGKQVDRLKKLGRFDDDSFKDLKKRMRADK